MLVISSGSIFSHVLCICSKKVVLQLCCRHCISLPLDMDLSRAGSYTFKTCHFRFTLYSGRLHHRVTCQKVTQIAIDQISYLK